MSFENHVKKCTFQNRTHQNQPFCCKHATGSPETCFSTKFLSTSTSTLKNAQRPSVNP